MNINDIKHLAVERIFLIPDSSEGVRGYLWCDDPAPGMGMDPSEAVEYVRKDVHDARIAELEEREAALAAHIKALADKMDKWADELDCLDSSVPDWEECQQIAGQIRVAWHYCDAINPAVLESRDEESMRKGFWWGFERARMHLDESNIAAEWQSVTVLMKSNEDYRLRQQAEAKQ